MKSNHRQGFTILELLIVIFIIGLLIQIALPAIQSAREAARRTQCASNLRQLGLGVIRHHESIGYYPTGGWNWSWLPDPDRGRGRQQPGSWIFCSLDFLEEHEISSIAKGKTGRTKSEAIVEMCAQPVPLFVCPSRRLPRAFPINAARPGLKTNDDFKLPVLFGARSDYAINTGDFGHCEPPKNSTIPTSLEQADDPSFKWYETSKFTGISFGRSEIRIKDITDGTSNTYMLGEKTIRPNRYLNGRDSGDNESMYSGFDNDNGRVSASGAHLDEEHDYRAQFGSAHPAGWNAVFCDGSVHLMSFSIDQKVHDHLANRHDGQAIPANIN